MESEQFLSLFDLLTDGYQPSVLATAIENHGLHGWDRFGRYGPMSAVSVDAKLALNALANIHEAMVNPDPQAEPWDLSVDHYSIISRYGWMQSVRPDLAKIQEGIVEVPRPQSVAKYEKNVLMLIGALLDFIEHGIRSKPHPGFKDIETLATAIDTATDAKYGLGRTSTLQKMRSARDALREKFPEPLRHN
jgi:hypothetical protein